MPWRRPLSEPGGMPRRSSRRHLHRPSPRRPGRRPRVQWQEPAGPGDDDRYSSFPPFFWCRGSLAVTLFFVEYPLGTVEEHLVLQPLIELHCVTEPGQLVDLDVADAEAAEHSGVSAECTRFGSSGPRVSVEFESRRTHHFALHRTIERDPSFLQLGSECVAKLLFQAPHQCIAKCTEMR